MNSTEPLKQIVKLEAAHAANHDFAGVVPTKSSSKPQPMGWDPIEVWRRMIKEPRQRRVQEAESAL